MKSIDDILDSRSIREIVFNLHKELSKEEIIQWQRHPCTKALLLTLQGDYLDIHLGWEGQSFIAPSSDGTAQLNAKALGQLEAIRDIINHIEEIHQNDSDDGV